MSNPNSQIRNFVVAGHSSSGKTSLCDLMLFKAGAVNRQGDVSQKTSVSDYTPDEQDKQSSIYASPLTCKWDGLDYFFIDTPGYGEFIGEVVAPINACDNALVVVDGINGLEIGATRAWKLAKERSMPRFIFINRLDQDTADFNRVLEQIQQTWGKTVCIPFTLPVGEKADINSVVSVLKAESFPEELASSAETYREQLMDAIAESDEELMMRYLDGEQLSDEEISNGLHQSIINGDIVPVFAGSVAKDVGVTELMNSINSLFPAPLSVGNVYLEGEEEPVSVDSFERGMAQVFKTIADPFIGQLTLFRVVSGTFKSDSEVYNTRKGSKERFGQILLLNGKSQEPVSELGPGGIAAMAKLRDTATNDTLATGPEKKQLRKIVFPNPVMSYAVAATKSGEEEKIADSLSKMVNSDPTFKVLRNAETKELIISGMGDQHLGNIVRKIKENNKLEVALSSPKIPYRETITSSGEANYRHKKQTGGHGQFAEVYLRIAPNEEGYEFSNEVVGGNIPKNYIPAVEKGVVEAMAKGPLAGCVVENIKVTVYDGKHHPVDSSEMAFKIASRTAFREGMQKSKPILLEPIMSVKIMIPDEYMGDISGDLNHKRGRILGMSAEEGLQVVNADIPLAEMARYATELRSMTQGRGTFEMNFSRYEMVPTNVANDVIDKFKKESEE